MKRPKCEPEVIERVTRESARIDAALRKAGDPLSEPEFPPEVVGRVAAAICGHDCTVVETAHHIAVLALRESGYANLIAALKFIAAYSSANARQ